MKSIAEIKAIRDKKQAELKMREEGKGEIRLVVGMATCGLSAGAKPVFEALKDEIAKRKLGNVVVTQSGCLGMCKLEPIVEVFVPGQKKVTYCKVDADKARNIVDCHVAGGKICNEYLISGEDL